MDQPLVVGAVSANIAHDKAKNIATLKDWITQAAASNVQMLVLPELALQGGLFELNRGFDRDEFAYHWEHAEPIPGESTALFVECAKHHDMHINFGMFEKVETTSGARLYNSSVFITPGGHITTYRKIHQPIEERIFYTAGSHWQVVHTDVATVGLMICYDQSFPEAARELTLRGAELLAVPSAWAVIDAQSFDRYDLFGRARALENNRYIVQSNQVGRSDKSDLCYLGNSRIIDPDGVVIAATPDESEGLAIAMIQPSRHFPARANTRWYLKQRKPGLYGQISTIPPDEIDSTS